MLAIFDLRLSRLFGLSVFFEIPYIVMYLKYNTIKMLKKNNFFEKLSKKPIRECMNMYFIG